VLNAKNYGIPQNRERVFAISIRKDIDTGYEFPIGFDNGKRLKDILETVVDEKYYISNERVDKLINKAINNEYCNKNASFIPEENKSCYALGSQEFVRTGFQEDCLTLSARDYKDPKCVVIKQATKQGYIECNIPGVIIDDTQGFDGTRYYSENAPTLRSQRSGLKTMDAQFRIRKITPLECWRLMGFTDEQFHKAEQVNSNSQLYKQAGNSIVVDVLYYLFKNLFDKN